MDTLQAEVRRDRNSAPRERGLFNALTRDLFGLALPATMESVLQFSVGLVAMAMIGHLGGVAIGAVGLGQRATQIIWAAAQMLTVGCTVLAAQSVGAGDIKKAWGISFASIRAGVVISGVVSLALGFFAREILSGIFGASGTLLTEASGYMGMLAFSIPFSTLTLVSGAALRGMGDSRTPMLIALTINLVNVLGHLILVPGRFGFPAYALTGSAVSTVVAQILGAMVHVIVLYKRSASHTGGIKGFLKGVHPIKGVVRLGWPAAMENLFWQAAQVILTTLIVSLGTVPLAAHQLGLQAEGLSYMPNVGFSVAAMTLVGRSVGAGDPGLARAYIRETCKWGGLLTLVTGGMLMVAPHSILSLLTQDQRIIDLGAIYLILMGIVQIPQQLGAILNGALRGAGVTDLPMIGAGIGIWGIRLPLAFLLGRYMGYGIVGIWVGIMVDVAFKFVFSGIAYFRVAKRDFLL